MVPLFWMALLLAGGKPDYSGDWRFNAAESKLEIPAPESVEAHIEHVEPDVLLSRTLVRDGKPQEFSIELRAGGEAVRTLDNAGRERTSRLYWEGSRLVFDAWVRQPSGDSHNLVRYELSGNGKKLMAEEEFSGPGLSYHNRWVFDRVATSRSSRAKPPRR
jgi:hypothetical protein